MVILKIFFEKVNFGNKNPQTTDGHKHHYIFFFKSVMASNPLYYTIARLILVVDVNIAPMNPYQPLPFHILSTANIFQTRILIYAASEIRSHVQRFQCQRSFHFTNDRDMFNVDPRCTSVV